MAKNRHFSHRHKFPHWRKQGYAAHYREHDEKSRKLRDMVVTTCSPSDNQAISRTAMRDWRERTRRMEIVNIDDNDTDERRACRLDAMLYSKGTFAFQHGSLGATSALQNTMQRVAAYQRWDAMPKGGKWYEHVSFLDTSYYHFMEVDLLLASPRLWTKHNVFKYHEWPL